MKSSLLLLLVFVVISTETSAQLISNSKEKVPDPKVAFLKSMAVPGWGHHYVDQSSWTRGQYHLAAEAGLVFGYLGFSIHTKNLQQNWISYGQHEAGVPIENRSRSFQLAVGDFNSLAAYNDYQLRSRNWDQLLADIPENRWDWSSDQERAKYNDLRSRFERINQQLPALLAMMAVNRIVSGISAYNRARKRVESSSAISSVYFSPYRFTNGVVASIKVDF